MSATAILVLVSLSLCVGLMVGWVLRGPTPPPTDD